MTNSTWSVSLGSWSGVQVRLHVTLVLVLLVGLLVSDTTGMYFRASLPFDRVVLIMLLGLASVVAHAASHVISAARRGWETREVVLAPWGEWRALPLPANADVLPLHFVGIIANVFLGAIAAILLWLHGDTSISEMLIPLDSKLLLQKDHPLVVIRWLFCINYCLVLMNLIPAAPFDGERILASLLRLSRPKLSSEEVHNCVMITGRIVGLLLIIVAVGLGQGDTRGLFPAWFPLTVLGAIALFAAQTPLHSTALPPPKRLPPLEEPADEAAEDIEGISSASVEWEDGPFAQWLDEKRELERARRQETQLGEMADEHRVDEILTRLHEQGPQSLSAEDRQVLQRVSDRLRRRKQKKS